MAVEDLNIRLSLPFPHRGQRSSGALSPGAVDIKQRTRPPLEKSGNQEGREEGMCVMLSEGLAVVPPEQQGEI